MNDEAQVATERHADGVAAVRHAVLDSPGHSDAVTRAAAADTGPLPEPLGSYVAKVRDHAHRVTDTDVDQLLAAGYSEDEIYEVTVAAAVGAALRSLDAGLRALRAGP